MVISSQRWKEPGGNSVKKRNLDCSGKNQYRNNEKAMKKQVQYSLHKNA